MDFSQRRASLNLDSFALGSLASEFDSSLYYLTGFSGRPAILVRKESQETLFIQAPTEQELIFDDPQISLEQISEISGIQDLRVTDLGSLHFPDLNSELIRRLLAQLRRIKSSEEIVQMRRAAQITRKAHQFIQNLVLPGVSEWEIKVEFERFLFLNGARETAYQTIAASGLNSTVLHARKYDRILQAQETFVLDGAAKFNHYASDVTSTFGGNENDEIQRIIEIVHRAQRLVFQNAKIGRTLFELHSLARDSMAEDLLKLKIISNESEIDLLFPHNTSHWIGLDVHDPKSSDQDQKLRLQEGMTFTVEPGLYFSPRLPRNYGKYHKIGVRLEEDVLITAQDCEILSG